MTSYNTTSIYQSKWFHIPRRVTRPRLRLFCFPYAGGGAAVYHDWADSLPVDVEMVALQLPGRGVRIGEEPVRSFARLVPQIVAALKPYLNEPFAFYGHSMGAKLAFETTRQLRRQHLSQPLHLFVSGSRAPQDELGREPVHHLPKREFRQRLRELNGTPEEVFLNEELLELVEPILRADFEAVETYQYQNEKPLNVPITALGGRDDTWVGPMHIGHWKRQTTSGFMAQMLPGDHFFLQTERRSLLNMVNNILSVVSRAAAMA